MKKLIFGFALLLSSQLGVAQTYYPLADPCDPDKIFDKLPSAAYDNTCVYLLRMSSQPFNKFPMEVFRYPNLKELTVQNANISAVPIDVYL